MIRILLVLIMLCISSASYAKWESSSLEAQSIVAYGQGPSGIVPIKVDSDGNVYLSSSVSAGVGTINTGTPGYLAVYAGSSTVDDTSVIYTNGTNVGIGTSSPTEKLQVSGNANVTGALSVYNANGVYTQKINNLSSGSYSNIHMGDSTKYIAFSTNGTEKARIDANGNVGIGTTSANSLLHIQRPVGAYSLPSLIVQGGGSSGSIVVGADVNNSSLTINTRKLARICMPEYVSASNISGNVIMLAGDSDGLNSNKLYFGGTPGGSMYAANYLSFLTANASSTAGGTEQMAITSSGNLGIGTTAPASSIHTANKVVDLAGAATVASVMRSTNSAQENSTATSGAGLNIATAGHATATNNTITFSTEETNSQYTPTERMRIDSNGNVGIGSTSPINKLEVVGSIKGTALLSTTGGVYTPVIRDTSGTGNASLYLSNTSGYTFRAGGVDRVFIPLSGNVGINSTSPSSTLDVIGTFHVSGVSTFDGNVGIGTSSPTTKLHVYSTNTSPDFLWAPITGEYSRAIGATEVVAGNKGYIFNSGSNTSTSGHGIGVFGYASDTTLGAITMYATEGRVDGHGQATYHGITGRGQWSDGLSGNTSVFNGTVIGVSSQSSVFNYDTSTPRYEGINMGMYVGTNIGGLFNYGLLVDNQNQGFLNFGVAIRTATNYTLQVGADADGTTANAGITFGASGDTNLYRSAAHTLKTDDNMVISGGVTINAVTTGYALCVTASKQLGHCTAGVYPLCTTCVAN